MHTSPEQISCSGHGNVAPQDTWHLPEMQLVDFEHADPAPHADCESLAQPGPCGPATQ
jgi:hypothetical protein